MKKVIASNCEKEFVYENIINGRRLDGRNLHDGRDLEIAFGKDDGSCIVMLGDTRVFAVVTCEITSPQPSRPAEGSLHINLDLSPMAAPNFSGRMSDSGIEASRLMERSIRDSKCIDLESLCIVSGLKVWCIRVNVQALNNTGNLIECACIAAISALAHFKRPDVTVIGTEITVHSPEDRNPIPLCLHHMPVIINLAIFDEGSYILVDPLELEERIAPGKTVIGVNAHQEICVLNLKKLVISREIDIQCIQIALKRAQVITQIIKTALDNDKYKKSTKQCTGFVSLMQTSTILGAKQGIPRVQCLKSARNKPEMNGVDSDDETVNTTMNVDTPPVKERVRKFLQNREAVVFEGGASQWQMDESESGESDDEGKSGESEDEGESSESESEDRPVVKKEKQATAVGESDGGSGEEDEHFLKSNQVDVKEEKFANSRGWYSKNPFL